MQDLPKNESFYPLIFYKKSYNGAKKKLNFLWDYAESFFNHVECCKYLKFMLAIAFLLAFGLSGKEKFK